MLAQARANSSGRGRAGRGRGGRDGRGRSVGGRGSMGCGAGPNGAPYIATGRIKSGLPSIIDKFIPDAMKACLTGWKETPMQEKKFVILTAKKYQDKYMRQGLIDSYIHATDLMSANLISAGLDVTAENTVQYLVSDRVFSDLAGFASQQLVKRDLPATNTFEMRRSFATKLLRSRFKISTGKTWVEILGPLATKHGFRPMEEARFKNIMTCIRGYDVSSRNGDNSNESWMQRKNTLRHLNDLEKNIFKRSIRILMNTKNGHTVVDDEMQGSNATDVECKAYSDRKAGKNGPVADCLADSMICMLLGIRLRVTGEPQRDNVKELMKTVPPVTNRAQRPGFSCDRGYTNEEMLGEEFLDPYDAVSINNKSARNPFFAKAEFDDWHEKCRGRKPFQLLDSEGRPMKDPTTGKTMLNQDTMKTCTDLFGSWVIDSDEKLGSDVRVATKDITRENGKTLNLTAVALRDTFDKKVECKDLFFLATGKAVRDIVTEWVASPKTGYAVSSNHIFSDKKVSSSTLNHCSSN